MQGCLRLAKQGYYLDFLQEDETDRTYDNIRQYCLIKFKGFESTTKGGSGNLAYCYGSSGPFAARDEKI